MSIHNDLTSQYFQSTGNPGVYVHWDRMNTDGVAFYLVQRANSITGPYRTIATVVFPQDDYVDAQGAPGYFYRVVEIGSNNLPMRTSTPMEGSTILLKDSVLYGLESLLQAKVNDEQVILIDSSRTVGRVSFNNWAYSPKPSIRIPVNLPDANGNPVPVILDDTTVVNSTVDLTIQGVAPDYPNGLKYRLDYNGKIYFLDSNDNPQPLQPYTTVYATYYVRMFTNEQINAALNMALQTLNGQAGSNTYASVSSVPLYYDPALVAGAQFFLANQLLLSLMNRERRMLLQDPDNGAFSSIDLLKEIKSGYKDIWDGFIKSIPIARYPHIAGIAQEPYALPGGRARMFRYAWKGMG